MKLLTKEIRKSLPVLGTYDGKDAEDVPIVVKGPFRLGVERDMYFGRHTLAEVKEKQM